MSERQQQLFETAPEPWELDDAQETLIAAVVFATGPDGSFDYAVPREMAGTIEVGCRVQVPLGGGNRLLHGFVIRLEVRSVNLGRLKSIRRVLDGRPLVSAPLLRLSEWIAKRYLCPLGSVLETVVPAGVRRRAGFRRELRFRAAPGTWEQRDQLPVTAKQRAILELLWAAEEPLKTADICQRAGCTSAPLQVLRKKQLVEEEWVQTRTFQRAVAKPGEETPLTLNEDQQRALNAIRASMRAGEHRTILIHGVTGSGKTEVYMQAIAEAVQYGRQAIVLVPEISLTPQTCARFHRRFQGVSVLHSHQSDVERAWHWERIASGEVPVVVGARSAVFAPTPQLGLIVLDEEHEATFKQETAPRYHAREVARFRTEAAQVPLVLGSATPSLESWQRAAEGDDVLIELPRRVLDRPLPDVAIVDLRDPAHRQGWRGVLSRPLQQAMSAALAADGQVILLLNRRGYATHIQCPSCGKTVECPHCEIALTHHRQDEKAICHYCDYCVPAPSVCPQCSSTQIRYSGRGTQKLEAELRSRFPNYACLRMDTDSMRRPGSHEEALARFQRGEVKILLGTQMIAKGLDFPGVTLVGVVQADMALHLPDFRAAERTFQLVTQVAGRTGRGERKGRVLVQTFNAEHPAIQAAARHDFALFAGQELQCRQLLGYPPFGAMVRVVIRGEQERAAREFAEHLAEQLGVEVAAAPIAIRVLGPAPCPIPKLRGRYRFHLQLQAQEGPALRDTLQRVTCHLKTPKGVQWIVDVDPHEML